MTRLLRSSLAALLAVPTVLAAQEVRVWSLPQGERARVVLREALDRPMIGVTTHSESERADTLGLLIDDVRPESPAAKAGLKEGDRLQAVNGVSLRADRVDAGEPDYNGVLTRRLSRAIEDVAAGQSVELRVLSEGRTRTVTVTPVKASELTESRTWSGTLQMNRDRAVLGLGIGSTGSPRDTLGVFVSSVTTDGPAEKAGIVEGDRIAAINGVSVRVAREDASDPAVGNAKANRLRREIERLEAGAVVELTVVTAGRSRTVRVTTVKASELPGENAFRFFAPGMDALQSHLRALPKVEWHEEPAHMKVPLRAPAPLRAPLTMRTRVISL